eukprot:COSAG06_NODE_14676_length_1136_cov_1.331726_2_plen_77_part_01
MHTTTTLRTGGQHANEQTSDKTKTWAVLGTSLGKSKQQENVTIKFEHQHNLSAECGHELLESMSKSRSIAYLRLSGV